MAAADFDDVALDTGPLADDDLPFGQPFVQGHRAPLAHGHRGRATRLPGLPLARPVLAPITHSLVAAKGSVSETSYRFVDRTAKRGVPYRYRIKALSRDGTTAWFGLVRAT